MPDKRSYGTGSLLESNGRWVGKWRVDGRQVKKVLGPVRTPGTRDGLTRVMAERELRRQVQADAGQQILERITIREAGAAHLAAVTMKGRKPATLMMYESQLRVHLLPFFGDTVLGKIVDTDIERFIRVKQHDGASAKTIVNILNHLNAIFRYAIRRRWVTMNPVTLVDKPREVDGDHTIRFLTQDEVTRLLAATVDPGPHSDQTRARATRAQQMRSAGEHPERIAAMFGVSVPTVYYYLGIDLEGLDMVRANPLYDVERLVYLTAAKTGLRQGELLGLQWQDIDFDAQRVRVRRSLVKGEYTSTKSRSSVRAVPLSNDLARALREHKRASAHAGAQDLVFAHPLSNKPLERTTLTARFKDAVLRADVGRFEVDPVTGEKKALTRFHDLRHTFGTQMAAAGVPIRTLQAWMGHADIQTTQIYADYAPSEHEVEMVSRAFGEAS